MSILDDDVRRAPREPQLPAPDQAARSIELTRDTSLSDLFQAILGVQARGTHDKSELGRIVDAQVRALRQELGLPDPVVERPVPVRPDLIGERALFGDVRTADETGPVLGSHRPSWRDLVTGLTDRAKNSVG